MKSTAQTSKRRRKGRKGLMRQNTDINFRRKHEKHAQEKKSREMKRNKYLNE